MKKALVKDLNPDLYRKLYNLNLREKGKEVGRDMRGVLVAARRGEHEGAFVSYFQDTSGAVAAWSITFEFQGKKSTHPETYIYVRKSERRNKLGTRLLNEASVFSLTKYNSNTRFSPFNSETGKFFNNLKDSQRPIGTFDAGQGKRPVIKNELGAANLKG